MFVKAMIVCTSAVFITACGVKKFECPYNDGVTCKSLSEVNEMVNRGEYGKRLFKRKTKVKEDFIYKEYLGLDRTLIMQPETKEPVRVPEKIVRIWLAPYESKDGTFHQQTFINTVVKPAHWVEGT